MQQRSAWLGDRDTFGDLLAGCRAMGMNVIARTDPHACWQKVYDAHPDWIRVDANGKPVPAIPLIRATGKPALSARTTSNS